jgi:ATP-dependent exoDNAse (exonuclease V) beta subunit
LPGQTGDITVSLKVGGEDADAMPRFTIHTDPAVVTHSFARETLTILRDLRRRAHATTPALLLGEAVERLAVRSILFAREGNERSRATANVERFLELARECDVLGLKRFVYDIANEWADDVHERTEGRVDAEGALKIVTMHSSKGLEWVVRPATLIRWHRKPGVFRDVKPMAVELDRSLYWETRGNRGTPSTDVKAARSHIAMQVPGSIVRRLR